MNMGYLDSFECSLISSNNALYIQKSKLSTFLLNSFISFKTVFWFSSFWCCRPQAKWFPSVPFGGVVAPAEKRTHFYIRSDHPAIQLNLVASFNISQFDFLRCYTYKVISSTRKAVLIFPFQFEWVLAANTTACFWVLGRKHSRYISCGLSVYINNVKKYLFWFKLYGVLF